MKKTILKIYSVLAALFILSAAIAQSSTYERTPGYYTFGINGGLSYQQSDDINTTLEGYGLGLTLGKNLYYRPGAPFAFDIRGRALYAQTKGLAFERSYGIANNDALNGTFGLDYTKDANGTGFVFQNNKTDQFELGIEGVLSFNKLRENTNVNLSLFGGIGLDWYNVKTDQAYGNGTYANQYLGIDTLGSVSYRRNELKTAILDGIYETSAHGFESGTGKLGLMPSLGVELGYQFTPRFSMGIGHKVTFTKTDLFDGNQWANNGNLSGEDDIHHYTNLHMRWIIDDKTKELREPFVDITNPGISPHTTRQAYFNVLATIKHVDSPMDVEFIVNGYNESFNFRKRNFNGYIRLRPGNNDIVVRARNAAGTASDQVNIFYQEEVITRPPVDDFTYAPEVAITNPPYEGFRTDSDRFDLRADVRNVNSSRDIELTVNGRNYSNFNLRNGVVSALIDLREGNNTIRVSAQNNDGYDADETNVILERTIVADPPRIRITRPSVDPYTTQNRNVRIEARVEGIDNRNDIRYTINGYEAYDFDYRSGIFYAEVNLNGYKTIVEVTAKNRDGQDSDNITIIYEEEVIEPVIERPVVNITSTSQPTVDPFDPTNCKSRVVATVLNIDDRNDIEVYVNGQRFYDFDYNANTQALNAIVKLVAGTNTIRIIATNAAGQDEDTAQTDGCLTEQIETPPTVRITKPKNNSVSKQQTINLQAIASNVSHIDELSLLVNGKTTRNFYYQRGTLDANIRLKEGRNTIFLEAQNRDGRASDELTVYYEKPQAVLPPKVDITKPKNNSVSELETISLQAVITNIARKDEVKLFLNGKSTSNFRYQRGTLDATIRLKEGKNVLLVKARNKDGGAEDKISITYRKKVQLPKPIVQFTNPGKGTMNVRNDRFTVRAKVLHVNNKRAITFKINGRRISTFKFSPKSGELSTTVTLREGKNEFSIAAQNEAGKDNAQAAVIFQNMVSKKNPPKISAISASTPTIDPFNPDKGRSRISATVQHVSRKSQIKLRVNGKKVSSFSFNAQSGKVEAVIDLKKGRNTIELSASSNDGSDVETKTVNFGNSSDKDDQGGKTGAADTQGADTNTKSPPRSRGGSSTKTSNNNNTSNVGSPRPRKGKG